MRTKGRTRWLVGGATAAVAAFGGTAPAMAEPAAGVIAAPGVNVLTTFDTATPGAPTSIRPITGLRPGDELVGLDNRYLRTADAVTAAGVYALGVIDEGATDSLQLYRLDVGTAVATAIGPPSAGIADGTAYGMDFNPTADRVRVVNDADASLRLNPNNGAVAGVDTALTPAGQLVGAVAYDRVATPITVPPTPGNTTLYALAATGSRLVTIGGLNATPSPNLGGIIDVGPLGVTVAPSGLDLDISGDGTAYATATVGGVAGFYRVNLATGAATLIGPTAVPLRTFAIVPASTVAVSAAAQATPEAGSATIAVTRSGAVTETASVVFSTSGGTATTADYTPTGGTLTFLPGESTKSIVVPVLSDDVDEPDETFTVTLSSPSAPTGLGAATTTVTVTDDDAAAPAPDRTKPKVTFPGTPATITLAKLRTTGLRIGVRPNERAALEIVLEGTATRTNLKAANNLTLARRIFGASAGSRVLTLKPPKALVGTPARRFTIRVRVVATDTAGNRSTTVRAVRVTVPPRR